MGRHRGVGGRVDSDELAVAQLVDLVIEEVDGAAQHSPLEARRAVPRRRDDHVGARPAEQGLGIVEWRSPTPAFDQPGIPGVGQRLLAEVRADQHGVLVFPTDLGLGLGHLESAGDEFACAHVEFTHDRGIRTAARQADQRQGMVGFDDLGAGPHPVLVVGGGQCVEVDDHLPFRCVGAVAVQCGAAPQPARVRRVAPEVVQVIAAAADVRDARIGVEHLERLGAHLLEPFTGELGERGFVAPANPVQRVVAGDVLEPEVGSVPVCSSRERSSSAMGPVFRTAAPAVLQPDDQRPDGGHE